MVAADQHALLSRECALAEALLKEITAQEAHDEESLGDVLADSPIQPWVLAQGKALLLLRFTKRACLVGSTTGHGMLITRLPTSSAMLIKWSAPLFVKLKLTSFGLSFGRQTTATFAVATSTEAQRSLASPAGHIISGLEWSLTCGATLRERADVISSNFAADINTVGVSKVSGSLFDLSFTAGALVADQKRNAAAYGAASSVLEILSGGAVPPPAEFSPLYAELSLIVHGVEKTSGVGPGRVSASLERYSTGEDPDRSMVLAGGAVIAGAAPPCM